MKGDEQRNYQEAESYESNLDITSTNHESGDAKRYEAPADHNPGNNVASQNSLGSGHSLVRVANSQSAHAAV